MEYVTVERDGLYDFRDLILNDVYEQLFVLDNFGASGIEVIGVLDGEEPVAAAVAASVESSLVRVLSLYVQEEARGRGIGSQLIEYMIRFGAEELPAWKDVPEVILDMEYVLEEADAVPFRRFLKKNGFQQETRLEEIYSVTGQEAVKLLGGACDDIHLLSERSEDEVSMIAADMVENGIDGEPALSAICGSFEDPRAMMITAYGGAHVYHVFSVDLTEELTENEYEAILSRVIREIIAKDVTGRILAPQSRNVFHELWRRISELKAVHERSLLTVVMDED